MSRLAEQLSFTLAAFCVAGLVSALCPPLTPIALGLAGLFFLSL